MRNKSHTKKMHSKHLKCKLGRLQPDFSSNSEAQVLHDPAIYHNFSLKNNIFFNLESWLYKTVLYSTVKTIQH